MPGTYQKTGYLTEAFRLFYNADSRRRTIPFHYHDFHKILLFLSGNVTYVIEGDQFVLEPGDIVLVRAGQIHRPIIHDDSLYERIIIYVDPDYFSAPDLSDLNLFSDKAGPGSLLRFSPGLQDYPAALAGSLKAAIRDTGFAAALLRQARFWEFLISVNRALHSENLPAPAPVSANPVISAALDYIHDHLSDEDLSIDRVAGASCIGRSYLMHLFKSQMGYTIGQYITEKRLYMAGTLMKNNVPVTQACYQCGFKNYAAFYYAYRKKYKCPPGSGQRSQPRIEGE